MAMRRWQFRRHYWDVKRTSASEICPSARREKAIGQFMIQEFKPPFEIKIHDKDQVLRTRKHGLLPRPILIHGRQPDW
jgi:hypothetical protein